MSQQRYEDCRCEDYPCCGHYDILHGDENQPEYCDMCGGYHSPALDCQYEDDEYDDDDDEDITSQRNPVAALISAASEYDAPHPWAEDAHLDSSWEEKYEL